MGSSEGAGVGVAAAPLALLSGVPEAAPEVSPADGGTLGAVGGAAALGGLGGAAPHHEEDNHSQHHNHQQEQGWAGWGAVSSGGACWEPTGAHRCWVSRPVSRMGLVSREVRGAVFRGARGVRSWAV